MGSYTGPFTYPVELDGERLVGLRVENEGTREQYPLELRATLKSGWRIAASSDGGRELLAVSCYPNAASLEKGVHPTDVEFDTTLIRYHFEGGRWVARQKTQPGLWEDVDDSFPARSMFP